MGEWLEEEEEEMEEAGRGRDVWFERGRRGWMECSKGKERKTSAEQKTFRIN